ncbi:DUF6966 domain-containing protein [Vibrio renipiscarius]|uniref:DUF6966 domain-containing protein n=1 Tax=Vibrio renipiscarius TaxID=1461322 RepID=A0A0C2N6R8_9VIBR|nr:hypothetical protein [Vibrio renipiscarius]KII75326.1 hypothetical protein OJ16_18735 [Vibrio renipiscarius]KII78778.1 hypothetical protein PL18_10845 [Vibrio renipiscarius]
MILNDEISALNCILIKYREKKYKLPTVHDGNDATRVLQKFAGMGSINDLYICKSNGHNIEKSDELSVNGDFRNHLENIRQACATLSSKS